MYENLLDELADRGLHWVFGEVGQYGLESHDFLESEETREWLIDLGADIIDGFNPNDSNSYPRADPKALLLLSQACGRMLLTMDGSLSQDLAIIAMLNAAETGHIPLEIEVIATSLIINGRYLECAIYFHDQFQQGIYDESFLPDVTEIINETNQWFEKMVSDQFDWPSEVVRSQLLGHIFLVMAKIVRGAYIHLEMGLRLMKGQQVSEFMQSMGPPSGTFMETYAKLVSKESNMHYATSHTMVAYTAFMYRNLAGVEVPIESILDSVYKACLDDADLQPEERFRTLFANILRLRILSGMGVSGERWDHAVAKADEAIASSTGNMVVDKFAELIEDFKTHGRIMNVEQYAEVLGRTI